MVLCLFVKTVKPREELGCALPPTAMNARARARGVGVGMYAPEKHQSILIPLAMQLFYQFLWFGHCATWLGRVTVAFNEHFVIAICLSIFLTGDTLWLQRWCHGGGRVKPRDYRRACYCMQIPNFLQTGTISTTRCLMARLCHSNDHSGISDNPELVE